MCILICFIYLYGEKNENEKSPKRKTSSSMIVLFVPLSKWIENNKMHLQFSPASYFVHNSLKKSASDLKHHSIKANNNLK